ncbi:MAG TPA: zf-HC2 domain-containing protein [Pyrinomonadaceae bacterium]|nr:zf-HC2 domain-containing protein [Pyrinomonadaceae bacterium]
MRLNSEDLRELYQRETARSARGSDDCLTEEMLARAVAGELSQPERERVADHIAGCSDCAKEFRALRSVKSWADSAPASEDAAQPIPFPASENGQNRSLAVEPLAQLGSRRVSFYFPYAVAAAALILSLILGWLLISKSRDNQRLVAEVNNRQATATEALDESRRQLAETAQRAEQESAARRAAEQELARRDASNQSSTSERRSAPDVNVPIIDLNPHDAGRGEQKQTAAAIQLPADTDLFTLILNLGSEDSSRDYSLEVTDQNSRTIWSNRNLRKSAYNNFTVALRRSSFPAGEYRLRIYGVRNGRRQLIEQYAIRLTYR